MEFRKNMIFKMKATHKFLILTVIVLLLIMFVQIPMFKRLELTDTLMLHLEKENVLYGKLSYLDLLAWFEIHRSLGVDRVLGYITDNLNEKARVVLGHYQRNDLFEALYFPTPFESEDSLMRSDIPISWNHKGVAMFDGQIRLSGYDYLVSIDADEYLLPTNSTETLRSTFTYLFYKNWGGDQRSPFSAENYLLRTEPTFDRIKHVVIPSRVHLGYVRTHNFTASTQFRRCTANSSDIAVYHFRACRRETPRLCNKKTAIRDEKVLKMFKTVEGNIERIRRLYDL